MDKNTKVTPAVDETTMSSRESYDLSKTDLHEQANGKYVLNSEDNGESSRKKDEEEKKDVPQKMVGPLEVFRFSNFKERLLMITGTLFSCIHGAAFPVMIIIFGNMTDMFISGGQFDAIIDAILPNVTRICPNLTDKDYIIQHPEELIACLMANNQSDLAETIMDLAQGDLLDQMREYAYYYMGIGGGVFIVGYIQVSCWQTAAYNQCKRIRLLLLQSIFRQEIGWFDVHEVGELNTRISDDVDQIEAGIGDKMSLFFQQMCAFLAGFVVGFIYGWKLTLVIIAVSPLLAVSGGFMAKMGASMATKELKAYAKAGAVAEEVLGALRTVVAFGGQNRECERYNTNLEDAKEVGVKKGIVNGAGMGVIFFIIFGSYALAFWYGTQLILKEGYTPGDLMIVFFCVLIGAFSLGGATPNIGDFANSRGAAYAIYEVIDSEPHIDSSSEEGQRPQIKGNIEFKDVYFNYPSRPTVPVLEGLSLQVNVGQTVALVGSSGCGKSTTVSLLQRFYDPKEGTVLVDGVDIRQINLNYLRQHIGVVSQEPVLFGTTIAENIRYGKDGATQEDIEKAAKMANAHNFIMNLPNKYQTLCGERGAQLSGGQKQRIAIARALVKDPRILLLDEATSALDTESEATVQAALDKARLGRTTIVIAHRLSTIKTADLIAGFEDGKLVEQGTHDELMQNGGVYYKLVTNQSQNKEDDHDYETIDDIGFKKPGLERTLSVQSDHSGRRDRTTSVGSMKHDEEEEDLPDPELSRIMQMNAPEWPFILCGCIASIISGGIQPAFAVVFAEILGTFIELDREELERRANFYSLLFLAIGLVAGLSMFTMSYMFSKSGEMLTMRLRQLTFKCLIGQDISYFDDHKNNVGALCTRLANDASAVKGATGSRLATMFQSLASVGAGIGIGFAYSWKLTLLIIGFAPFIMGAGFLQMKVMQGNKEANRAAMEGAGKVAIEGIENMRTVAALTKEKKFHADYAKCIEEPYTSRKRRAHIQGAAYGFSQGIVFFCYAACFTLGAHLIDIKDLDFTTMFKVFGAIVFGAMSAGQATSFAPDYGKAKASAARLFQLFDSVPLIDSFSDAGDKPSTCNGQVTMRGVMFNYPTRPNVQVLKGLDLLVQPGQTVALVGSSGCGKSTTVQLLERFYDPLAGVLAVDGNDIRQLNVQWLRAQMGIVSQEPVLFDCSIRDNIAYGDNRREVPMAEIIEAAMKANIHSKIQSLPLGYETKSGDRGGQLSGGEKQRVAIARALIRNPKILLLDEATSALDTESEKVVQEALDKAAQGRTSIIIAHRLSTIQNADLIVVIHNGTVAEMGKHAELIQKQGIYYQLNNAQLRQR